MEENIIEHESFGTLKISRIIGDTGNLFASSIEHQNFIEISISQAYLNRNLMTDWIHNKKGVPLITIRMSNTQFAQAITSMNCGIGTPITISETCIDGKYKKFEEPPRIDKKKLFDDEFGQSMKELADSLTYTIKGIQQLSMGLSIKKQDEIKDLLRSIDSHIRNNIPFIKKQYTEQIEYTQMEAKGEIEGFFLHKISQLGLKELQNENKKDQKQITEKGDSNKCIINQVMSMKLQ